MTKKHTSAVAKQPSRREFLSTSGMLAGTALAGSLAIGRAAHATGSDTLRIGLLGCGGRGAGAVRSALTVDPNAKLVAMYDPFLDRDRDMIDPGTVFVQEPYEVVELLVVIRKSRLQAGSLRPAGCRWCTGCPCGNRFPHRLTFSQSRTLGCFTPGGIRCFFDGTFPFFSSCCFGFLHGWRTAVLFI